MGKQQRLEKVGIEQRDEKLIMNDFQNVDGLKYDENSDLAKSHDTEGHPYGKGSQVGQGDVYVLPNENASRTQIKPQLPTVDGGGHYDKFGRQSFDSGRNFLSKIALYTPENQYGENSVDTSINRERYSQYSFYLRDKKTIIP